MLVHQLSTRLARLMYQNYRAYTPECNAAPLLWRTVFHLCGTRAYSIHLICCTTRVFTPVEMYPATLYILSKKLARVLSLTLTLHHSLSPALKRIKQRDPEHHKFDNAPVEVSLAAVVIVVLKLAYGLDGRKR